MAIAIDSPQYSVLVQPDNEQVLFMALLISTSSTMQQFYLCRSDGYTTAAREMHDKIMQAGKEMKPAPPVPPAGYHPASLQGWDQQA